MGEDPHDAGDVRCMDGSGEGSEGAIVTAFVGEVMAAVIAPILRENTAVLETDEDGNAVLIALGLTGEGGAIGGINVAAVGDLLNRGGRGGGSNGLDGVGEWPWDGHKEVVVLFQEGGRLSFGKGGLETIGWDCILVAVTGEVDGIGLDELIIPPVAQV
ncbi:hypothetical protein PRK78_005044 [Emydomyces testavorans]|uniref:Uncharacterized protein n=1 Tax=Emydomyces testavorans TaxID=2070801 RepID=A0AAF0DMM3_9EURO|nr:hypothetical protein PRK78_005044 [Emydomyces testavorans]